MGRTAIVFATASLGVLVGGVSLHVAREEPAYSFAGASAWGAAALLGAGWALIGVGLASWFRRSGGRFGLLLVAAGLAWFLLEWNNPGVGSALAFTVGLVFYAACPPLAGHAMLGRLRSRLERVVVAVAYVGSVLVLGLLPALFFDPHAQACGACPRNLVLLADRPGAVDDLNRVGVYAGLAWAIGVALLAARRARSAVAVAGAVYMCLVAGLFAASLDRGFVAAGALERKLWLGQAAALTGIALGVAWRSVRMRRARTAVARLVVELAQSPPPGGLRDALAALVADPGLVLAYPLGDSGRLVDGMGRPVELPARRERTRLVHDGRTVAVLAHAPGLLDDDQLVHEVTAAARLALENERLQAEVRARLEELRASRARIVEAGDAERKRLERDLHDGAQQRLMGVSLSLSLVRGQLPAVPRLDEAAVELRSAITELRELAHGIFPAVLADEGLAAAVEALAEESHVPMRIDSLPERRFPPPVETAAFTVVVEAARAATAAVGVRARCAEETLALEIESRAFGDGLDVVALEDRVGALDGHVAVERQANGRVTIRAELPCGS